MKLPLLFMLALPVCAFAASEGIPSECTKGSADYELCLDAQKFAVSKETALNAWILATHEYAGWLCGFTPDADWVKTKNQMLDADARMKDVYEWHLKFLNERCVYDPDGWCVGMGYKRK
ncbi:MAG: hypothetical protein J6I40_07165 [Mailhella sp.]|nr:hypothetical protein [Mailhella sp.]